MYVAAKTLLQLKPCSLMAKFRIDLMHEKILLTDDELSPEYVISSSSGYNPVKSEETDEEQDDEDTNTINQPIRKEEGKVKTENDIIISTDDELSSEMECTKYKSKIPDNRSNATIQETTKKKRYSGKRKRELEESNGSVQKTAHIICSVEGCTRKAADSGKCKKHNGYYHCKQQGCTKASQNGGVCIRHGAVVKRKTCRHEGCLNNVIKGGVCIKHGAKKVRKTCSYDRCTNIVVKGGVCIKHGAKVKTCKKCSHEGCTKGRVKGGLCRRHFRLSNGV